MESPSIPCHVIAGPLGVGKTTAILGLLRILAERGEQVAVIVNDFGRTGLDAAILGGEGAPAEIRNLPGGCLCCSSLLDMRDALQSVAQRRGLSRILIEPSGLAILPDLAPYLRRLCAEFGLDLRPVVALIHPKRIRETHVNSLPFFASLVEHADILVANRCDQCTEAQLEHFREWTSRLDPPKTRILETSFGGLPPDLLDLRLERASASGASTGHSSHPERSGGFTADLPAVSATAFRICLDRWAREGVDGAEVLRFKAALPTPDGGKLFEIAQGEVHLRDTTLSGPARLDWISRGTMDEEAVRAALARCRAG